MAEKETKMVMKVDLQCCRCYKKVKKVLAKFPQIREEMYDEKANTVTIHVVCCSPEKIRDKICWKVGGSIKCIEIIPPTPPTKTKPEISSKPPSKTPKPPERACSQPIASPPVGFCCTDCYHGRGGGPCYYGGPPPPPPKPPGPACPRPTPPPPDRFCCTDCCHGRGGGPCCCGGPPPPPPPCYVTYWMPVCDSWGGGGGYEYCYGSQGCSIM